MDTILRGCDQSQLRLGGSGDPRKCWIDAGIPLSASRNAEILHTVNALRCRNFWSFAIPTVARAPIASIGRAAKNSILAF